VTAVPPSAEVVAEVARRVAEAYPSLYAHQRLGVAFLLARRRAILADEMGLGKTRQAIVAAREAVPAGPYLVVCPSSVKLNWAVEIDAVEPGADVHVVAAGDAFEPGHRWTVITYDLHGRCEEAVGAVPWQVVIVDEAHYIRNRSRRTSRLLRLLGADERSGPDGGPPVVYLLTGTPMVNRPRDLYNLLRVVRHPVAQSFYAYAKRYCDAYDNGYGLDTTGASNVEELARLVSGVMLRRTKEEAVDLPEKVRSWFPVEVPSARAKALEARALDYLEANPARSGPSWTRFLGMLTRARQALAVAKVAATADLVGDLVEAGDKVVVFSSFTDVVRALKEHFGDAAVTITGDRTPRQRHAAAQALKTDSRVRVLVGNLHAAGVGINLTAARHVVFNDLDWVPGNHWQAEDRIHRIGQTARSFVTYCYVPDTLDAYVAALLEVKARNIGVLEEEAASSAGLLEQVVEAALRGQAPGRLPAGGAAAGSVAGAVTGRGAPAGERAFGVLDDVVDLWLAQRNAELADPFAAERTTEVPSSSDPGRTYTVRVAGGVITCTCPGFTYRGNCKHARSVAAGAS
jgi:SWI/SNF-related matrix-associated actin-dependent regulator 1 of chromatin subfamily A